MSSMDNARHEFENNKKNCERKCHLLQFPAGHLSSSKAIFEGAGDNEELDHDFVDLNCRHVKVSGMNAEHWMHFKAARTDLSISKRGRVEEKEKKSKMAALLEAKHQQPKREEADSGMKDEEN